MKGFLVLMGWSLIFVFVVTPIIQAVFTGWLGVFALFFLIFALTHLLK